MENCIRYTITNDSANLSAVISYNRCSDNFFVDEYAIKPLETVRVWAWSNTLLSALLPFITVVAEDFPITT